MPRLVATTMRDRVLLLTQTSSQLATPRPEHVCSDEGRQRRPRSEVSDSSANNPTGP
jgi:hypothetical protein